MDRMGDAPSPIMSVIQPITIDTMLNNIGLNNGHGLKNVTCKQGLDVYWGSFATIVVPLAIMFRPLSVQHDLFTSRFMITTPICETIQ